MLRCKAYTSIKFYVDVQTFIFRKLCLLVVLIVIFTYSLVSYDENCVFRVHV